MISHPPYHRGTSKNLNNHSVIQKINKTTTDRKTMANSFHKKINAENEDCCTFSNSNWGWESRTDKTESAAGLSLKKRMGISTMADVDGYTAPRVHEPVG